MGDIDWELRQSQPSAVAVLEKATENQPTKIYFNVTQIIFIK